MFSYTLGDNVEVGQKIRTKNGWQKIEEVKKNSVILKDGNIIQFGEQIFGWKAS